MAAIVLALFLLAASRSILPRRFEEAALAASSLIALTGASYDEARQTLRAVAERATSRRKGTDDVIELKAVLRPATRSIFPGMEDRASLTSARSMLIPLLAACKQTQAVLEAASNALDTDLTADLGKMIQRTEGELVALNEKIEALHE
jgi:hypothetical protein